MSAGDHLEVPLAQGRGAPRSARDHVGAFLEAHGFNGEVRQDALLIVSELVANAVVHAVEPITLDVAVRDDTLRLEVCDGDDRGSRCRGQAYSWWPHDRSRSRDRWSLWRTVGASEAIGAARVRGQR